MSQITYYAPAGVTSINLSDGSRAVVVNGQITVDSKFRNELETAGCTANAETDNAVRFTKTVTGGSGILLDGRVVVPEEEQAYKLPPAKVRITATQIVVGKPIGLKSVKCVVGTAIALTIYDNGTAAAGTVLFTQTMSAGDEWSVPTAIQAVNGLQATFTGTATFDVEVQDAA